LSSENIRFWHSVITRPFASGFTRRRFGLRIIYPKKKEIRIKITRHKCLKTNALPRGSTNAKFSIMAIMIKKPNKLKKGRVSSKSQKFKMGDAEIVQGVNCPIARWIYRGICMLAVVSWLIELALEPEFSSLSEPKQKESPGMLVLCSAPFLIYTVVVVSYDGNYVRCINSSLLALIGYLGYQRPVWPACLFVVALVIVNAFIFYGVLRLDLPKPPEPEEEERDYQDSPV
ncbi:hypothetical protein HID58_044985, partial [Brassica napus]